MGKEVKIGLSIIGVLLLVLGAVVYNRFRGDTTPVAQQEREPAARLSSGPLAPTVVQADSIESTPTPGAEASDAAWKQPETSRYSFPSDSATLSAEQPSASMTGRYAHDDPALVQSADPQLQAQHQRYAMDAGGDAGEAYVSQGEEAPSALATDSSTAAPVQAVSIVQDSGDHTTPEGTGLEPAEPAAVDQNPLRREDMAAGGAPSRENRLSSGPGDYDLYGTASPTEAMNSATPVLPVASPGQYRYPSTDTVDTHASPATQEAGASAPPTSGRYGYETPPPADRGQRYSPPFQQPAPLAGSADSGFTSRPAEGDTHADHQPAPAQDGFRPLGGTYVVEPNDNFWRISEKVYGSGAFFKAIQEHNRQKYPQPDRLQSGDVIDVPSAEALMQTYPDLCPKPQRLKPTQTTASALGSRRQASGGRTYVVVEGDTLFDIARYELGKASRWAEIYELNQDVIGEDVNHLDPGTELLLPSNRPADTTTLLPGTILR